MIRFQRRKKSVQVENIKYRVGKSRCSIPRWKRMGLILKGARSCAQVWQKTGQSCLSEE